MKDRELRKYRLAIGDRGRSVRVVKELLHCDSRIPYKANSDDRFDRELQAAVAKFQTTVYLRNRSGTVDEETWRALGKNQLKEKLRFLAYRDATLFHLLRGSVTTTPGRGLTSGEVSLATSIFKTSVDYSKVKVHQDKYLDLPFGAEQPDDTLMTPVGEIYAPGGTYSKDYSQESDDWKGTFIHEMCHVWQWQRNIKSVRTSAAKLFVYHITDYDQAYNYTLREFKDLKEYGLEEQATIIEDYYRVIVRNMQWKEGPDGKWRIQNLQASYELKRRLLDSVVHKFIHNPSY